MIVRLVWWFLRFDVYDKIGGNEHEEFRNDPCDSTATGTAAFFYNVVQEAIEVCSSTTKEKRAQRRSKGHQRKQKQKETLPRGRRIVMLIGREMLLCLFVVLGQPFLVAFIAGGQTKPAMPAWTHSAVCCSLSPPLHDARERDGEAT